jgi:hypothetical protein
MTMETSVQIFAIIHLGTMGMSHILAPRAWTDFFIGLRERGHPGVFVVAFMSLGFGSIIAAFHPVWSGIPLALTVVGWGQVLKAFLYFCFPAYGLRRLNIVTIERSKMFIVPGVALVGLAGLLLYHVLVT